MDDTKRIGALQIVGIIAVFCTMSEFSILTPSIAAFAAHFANTDFTTIMFANSVTGIVSIPFSIVSGIVMHKVGFKLSAIVGILVMTLGGAFPFLLPDITDYNVIIFSRVIVGIGLGWMFPVGAASIIAFFDGPMRTRLLGLGIMMQFVFSIIYSIVAGFLTEISWNYSFLSYLVALVPLAFVIALMPEAKSIVAADMEKQRQLRRGLPKERVPKAIWGYALYGLLVWMAMVSVQLVASTIMSERGIGDAGLASIVLSFCGVGMIVSGLILPYLVKLLKSKVFAVSAIVTAVGFLPCFFAGSAPVYAAGVFLVGLGSATFFNSAQNAAGNIAPVSRIPFVSGVMTAMMNLGPFFAPYFVTGSTLVLASQGNSAVFLTGFALCLVMGIVGFVLPLKAIAIK